MKTNPDMIYEFVEIMNPALTYLINLDNKDPVEFKKILGGVSENIAVFLDRHKIVPNNVKFIQDIMPHISMLGYSIIDDRVTNGVITFGYIMDNSRNFNFGISRSTVYERFNL